MKQLFSMSTPDKAFSAKCFRHNGDVSIKIFKRSQHGFAPFCVKVQNVAVGSLTPERAMQVLRLQAHITLTDYVNQRSNYA